MFFIPFLILGGFFAFAAGRGRSAPEPLLQGDELGGWFSSEAWYALYFDRRWRGPLRLTEAKADNWYLDALEATRGAFSNTQLWKWTGSRWVRAR